MWWGFGENGFRAIWLALIPESLNNRAVQHQWPSQNTLSSSKPPQLQKLILSFHLDLSLFSSACTFCHSACQDHLGTHTQVWGNCRVGQLSKQVTSAWDSRIQRCRFLWCEGLSRSTWFLSKWMFWQHGVPQSSQETNVPFGTRELTVKCVLLSSTAAHYSNWWLIMLLPCWGSLSI